MKKQKLLLLAAAVWVGGILTAQALITVPQSALSPGGWYYTDLIGGGIGNVAVMTGGGSAPGIGDPSGRNDDGFSGPINLGFTLNFFGNNYTTFYANNNGNISFGAGISQFTPTGPTGASAPIISPFFSDVDTRASAGVMRIRQDIPDELIVTWDQVGYYSQHATPTDSFQLVVRGPGYSIPVGEGAIGFFYGNMGWEQGDVSNVPAAVGFGDGLGDGEVLAGSTAAGIAGVVANHYIWFDPNLTPIPTPDAGSSLLLLSGAVSLLGALRRKLSN
jgi:hypothetical protein